MGSKQQKKQVVYDFIEHVGLKWMDGVEAAKSLKKTRCILTSTRETLQNKDADAAKERVIHKGSQLFKSENILRKTGYEECYNSLISQNKLLFTLDLIKEKLKLAYLRDDECLMAEDIIAIMDMCKATNNPDLLWFERLLDSHFEGIIAHATYKISAGKW